MKGGPILPYERSHSELILPYLPCLLEMSQNVSSRAEGDLLRLSERLVSRRADAEVLATADKEQSAQDRLALRQQTESLSSQVAHTMDTVHGFLQELRQDVPTGE